MVLLLIFMLFNKTALCRGYHEDQNPKTTALIFASGKMVCTGAKTEALAREAARKYAKVIIKLGFPAQFKDFKIQNMVGSCDVRFQYD